MKTLPTTYLLARLPIGMSFLGHGISRIPKISTFAESMSHTFQETLLPTPLVNAFGIGLPFLELLIGIFLLLGLAVRFCTATGALLMCVLIFGSSLIENWSAVAIQLFYGSYLVLLYRYAEHNQYALFSEIIK